MSISVVCPACGGKMSAPSQLIGRMAKCPKCARAIKVVPSADALSPADVDQPASAPTPSSEKSDGTAAAEPDIARKGGSRASSRRVGLSLAGLAASLAVLVSGMFWLGLPGRFFGTAAKENEPRGLTPTAGPGQNHEATTAAPRQPIEPKDGLWADASKGPIEQGNVRVQLLGVTVRNVRIRDLLGEETISPTKNLAIAVRIENTSTTRTIDFPGWSGAGRNKVTLPDLLAGKEHRKANRTDMITPPEHNAASLTDNFGNRYEPMSLAFGARILGQISTTTPLDPGKHLEDLLVFDPPVDNVHFLRLELPAAVGDRGSLRLQIPNGMIHR